MVTVDNKQISHQVAVVAFIYGSLSLIPKFMGELGILKKNGKIRASFVEFASDEYELNMLETKVSRLSCVQKG